MENQLKLIDLQAKTQTGATNIGKTQFIGTNVYSRNPVTFFLEDIESVEIKEKVEAFRDWKETPERTAVKLYSKAIFTIQKSEGHHILSLLPSRQKSTSGA